MNPSTLSHHTAQQLTDLAVEWATKHKLTPGEKVQASLLRIHAGRISLADSRFEVYVMGSGKWIPLQDASHKAVEQALVKTALPRLQRKLERRVDAPTLEKELLDAVERLREES